MLRIFGHLQVQIFLEGVLVPILIASSIVSGSFVSTVSGKQRAKIPAINDTVPMINIGAGK